MAARIYTADGEITDDAPAPKANAPVPVWDPDTKSLRAVDKATATRLVNEGYAAGPEAQAEALRNSATYKLAGFAAKAGEAGSMGLSNLANLALGNKAGLREVEHFSNEHPIISGAGSFLGYGASFGAGAGRLGTGLAAKLGTTTARSIAAHVALPGAVAGATEGAADELTRESLMRDPVHLEQIAWSAMSGVLWNSAANVLGFGIGKLPGFLRNKVGDWADWAERTGWHEAKLKKDAVVPQQGPQLSRATFSGKQSFEDSIASQELNRTESIDDLKERVQTEQFSQATIKRATSAADEGSTKRATTTKTSESKSGPAAAAESPAIPESAEVGEIKPVFDWPTGYNKDAKIAVLRRMTKFRLNADPTHLQMWDEVQKAENEIQKWQAAKKQGEKAIAKGKEPDFTPETCNEQITKYIREKEDYKKYLSEAVPREMRGDKFVPGFKDLNEEYARVVGNPRNDLADPTFGVAVPRAGKKVPGSAKSTASETESAVDTSKFRRSESDATTTVDKDRLKTDTTVRDYDKEVAQTRTDTKNVNKGEEKYTVTFTFPKKPPTYTRVGIKQPFPSTDIAQTLIAGSLVPGLGTPSKAAAGYMGARNTLAWLATHRGPIGNFVGGAGDRLLKYGTPTLKATVAAFADRGRHKPFPGVPAVDVAAYQRAFDVLNTASSNPQAVQSYMQQAYPGLHDAHPEAAAQIGTTIMRGARMLYDTVPKRPYTATLRDTTFTPPRAQQVRMLSRWQIMANPQMALRTGDPQTLQLLQEVYPAWYKQEVNKLLQDTQAYRGPIMGQAARNITAFTGAPVNPMNNAAAQKRLQASAAPVNPQDAGASVRSGPQSTKTANAAAQRDNPTFELE